MTMLRNLAEQAITAYFENGDHLEAMAKLRDHVAVLGRDRDAYAADVQRARDEYATDDVEIDDEPDISEAENGVWVAAWVWVRALDADEIEEEEDAPTA